MIQIEHEEIDRIALDYFNQIKISCQARISFYQKIFEVLITGNIADLEDYAFNGNSRMACTNRLLVNKVGSLAQFDRVNIGNLQAWVTPNRQTIIDILDYLGHEANLKSIILVSATDAYGLDHQLQQDLGIDALPGGNAHGVWKLLDHILDYALFDKHAYSVASELDINTCPYCNRNYINTVIDKNKNQIIRPTFDHFFPHSRHPFLGISFYNLIPSCYFCNSSLKTATIITPGTHLHPYLFGFGDDCFFRTDISKVCPDLSDRRNFEIKLEMGIHDTNTKYRKVWGNDVDNSEGNCQLFKLQDIYNSHTDIVGELYLKAIRYGEDNADTLYKVFSLLDTNKEEFYRFYFGNYFDEKNFNKRPMAKLTKDILKQVLPDFFTK
ncbi:hypothetical protein [Mucilaginibacter sp. OK283]|uniref:hypothetical protein n=1 Tax=Mucilaginibacter sp. OK283 TaxID=1881049 RepID=UPI0008D87F46|nr:hypothetical protein [Mucilaginibacter sp. OK283]SEO81067.1 hypothetical protein SAMN05428947_104174 [Mucilaginibacter sp. OK283]